MLRQVNQRGENEWTLAYPWYTASGSVGNEGVLKRKEPFKRVEGLLVNDALGQLASGYFRLRHTSPTAVIPSMTRLRCPGSGAAAKTSDTSPLPV